MKEVPFFEISGTDEPLTRRHIPDERNGQLHRCENLKTRTPKIFMKSTIKRETSTWRTKCMQLTLHPKLLGLSICV